MMRVTGERSPAFKLFLAILVGAALAIPIFMVWFQVYDRRSQSEQATQSITAGWGGPQALTGPVLVIPYRAAASETVIEGGRSVTRSRDVTRELTLAPESLMIGTRIFPERRSRAIYEAVVYTARIAGDAVFTFPPDLERLGIAREDLDLARAELRFGISDPRGLSADSRVKVGTELLRLQPGAGSTGGSGFFAWIDVGELPTRMLLVRFDYGLRGSEALTLAPQAGHTTWQAWSPWPHPSFAGDFLPERRIVDAKHFEATYRIGNLALGRTLVSTGDVGATNMVERIPPPSRTAMRATVAGPDAGPVKIAQVSLIQPVDLYSKVDRSVKYGFLFIGFTFLVLLMFDVIGGVRVSPVEYLLMGAALVLFFVLLLAFAEVIGFTPAYVVAASAIAGLNTAYSAAVLGSWRRASFIGGLLIGLYAVLYILLSLEEYALLIGSLLLFAALAAVMYATRRIDWGARRDGDQAA